MNIPPYFNDRQMTTFLSGPTFLLAQSPVIHIRCLPTAFRFSLTLLSVYHFLLFLLTLLIHNTPAKVPLRSFSPVTWFRSAPLLLGIKVTENLKKKKKKKAQHSVSDTLQGDGGFCLNLSGVSSSCLPVCFSMSNPL